MVGIEWAKTFTCLSVRNRQHHHHHQLIRGPALSTNHHHHRQHANRAWHHDIWKGGAWTRQRMQCSRGAAQLQCSAVAARCGGSAVNCSCSAVQLQRSVTQLQRSAGAVRSSAQWQCCCSIVVAQLQCSARFLCSSSAVQLQWSRSAVAV